MSEAAEQAEAVRVVMKRYTDAVRDADVEALRGCFHADAAMSGYLGDRLLTGGPEPFFADIGANPSMASSGAPYKPVIMSLEVVGRVASVRVDETGFFGAAAFANWFHLVKDQAGDWKIVSKAFTTLA